MKPEWIGAGIRMNSVAPGKIATPMVDQLMADPVFGPLSEGYPTAIGRDGRPEEVAAAIAFLLSDDGVAHRRLGALRRRRNGRDPAPDLPRGLGRRTRRALSAYRREVLKRLLVVLAVPGLLALSPGTAVSAERDPRLARQLYVDQHSQPYVAAQGDHRFDPIALTPMARWFTDSAYPVAEVAKEVRAYARSADKADRTPVVVVYAIPGRDCGGYSAGGLRPRAYKKWVRELAAGLKGLHAMAVLEPDALPNLGACEGPGYRATGPGS